PGFNWWIARRAKAHGIPVFYYVPPQIWAWASWRVKKMRAFVDHVLCSLPFEAAWYRERGCNATFLGHPYFDEVGAQVLDEKFVAAHTDHERPLVTILPGSRTLDVTQNLETFLKAAALVRERVPSARFAIASFKPHQAQLARQMVAASGLPVDVFVRRTPELIRAAECCLAVSGSVSLELLYQTKPTAILYRISPFAFRVQKHFRHTRYITLVNMLASGDVFPRDVLSYEPEASAAPLDAGVLFPEYLTCEDKSRPLADHIVAWLTDRPAREKLVAQLAELKQTIGHGGASRRATSYILDALVRRPASVPRPHFLPTAQCESSAANSAAPNSAASNSAGPTSAAADSTASRQAA
ncbi:MAG TPA: hypothetical protein VG433_09900, partial [Pirellulales bacterium]|nr:hypothetical protein [Pirellulales bacterium]